MTTAKADTTKRISLADEEQVKKLLTATVFGLWDIVNNLTRLQPSKRPYYRVSIFGSARLSEGGKVYEEVKALAAGLTAMGCDIVTGGGPGLMQAANEGAVCGDMENKQRSLGIRITLPFEQSVNKFVEDAYEHQTFFTRLHHFVLASDAFIVVPGGIGTVLETLMVWQLLQVKHLPRLPLILIGEMYGELVQWATKHMVSSKEHLANPEDMTIPRCVNTVSEAMELIRIHREQWLKS